MKIWKGTLALLLAGTVNCRTEPLAPLPLEITIQANPSLAAPAQEITFEIAAQGGQLLALSVDYGDTNTYEADLQSSRTAEATLRHGYAAPGVYTVTAVVEDAGLGSKQATTSVEVR